MTGQIGSHSSGGFGRPESSAAFGLWLIWRTGTGELKSGQSTSQKKLKKVVFRLDFCRDCGILFAVMRDKMIKLKGPNGTTKEITAEEWASYTPLNALANARIAAAASRVEEKYSQEREDAFNGGYDDLAGHCDGPED